MGQNLTARDVMTKSVITLNPGMTLHDAWLVFNRHKISGAPVVDKSGALMGVLSQADLVREAFADHFKGFSGGTFYVGGPFFEVPESENLPENISAEKVQDVMNGDSLTASVSDSVSELSNKMREHHVHRLIILDNNKVVGIVSALDLLALIR